jgi:hypothetical protein
VEIVNVEVTEVVFVDDEVGDTELICVGAIFSVAAEDAMVADVAVFDIDIDVPVTIVGIELIVTEVAPVVVLETAVTCGDEVRAKVVK